MAWWLLLIPVIALAVGLLFRKSEDKDNGWQAGPVINGRNYSLNVPDANLPNLDLHHPGVQPHYITKDTERLDGAKSIRMIYTVEGGDIVPVDAGLLNGQISLYIEHRDNDWRTGTHRWYFYGPRIKGPGTYEINAPLNSPEWVNVYDDNQRGFEEAKRRAARVGYVCGGGSGAGHGFLALQPAKITVKSFDLTY